MSPMQHLKLTISLLGLAEALAAGLCQTAMVRLEAREKIPVGQARLAQGNSAADAQLACHGGTDGVVADGVVADACLLLVTIQHGLEGPGGIQ